MKKKKAFNLIELLVVILILITLLSLILKSLHTVRGKAITATCASNLKELHKSIILYLLDNDTGKTKYLPKPNEFFNQVSPDDSLILKDYAETAFDNIRCPNAKKGELGYTLNYDKLVNNKTNCELVSKSGDKITYDDLLENNILIYEVQTSTTTLIDRRHMGKSLGITVYGEIYYNVENTDLENQNS